MPVFHLDDAPSHTVRPENALNAYKMKVKPGIKYIYFSSLLKRFCVVCLIPNLRRKSTNDEAGMVIR